MDVVASRVPDNFHLLRIGQVSKTAAVEADKLAELLPVQKLVRFGTFYFTDDGNPLRGSFNVNTVLGVEIGILLLLAESGGPNTSYLFSDPLDEAMRMSRFDE